MEVRSAARYHLLHDLIALFGRQVMMAHGRATGWINWGGERFEFEGAPCYSEKNWGGGFPDKWFWVQCDSFDGDASAGLTCVGALHQLTSSSEALSHISIACLHKTPDVIRGRSLTSLKYGELRGRLENGVVNGSVTGWQVQGEGC